MEDSVYSIHLLIIILVIVLVLDMRESTVLVSALSGLDNWACIKINVADLSICSCWALVWAAVCVLCTVSASACACLHVDVHAFMLH